MNKENSTRSFVERIKYCSFGLFFAGYSIIFAPKGYGPVLVIIDKEAGFFLIASGRMILYFKTADLKRKRNIGKFQLRYIFKNNKIIVWIVCGK